LAVRPLPACASVHFRQGDEIMKTLLIAAAALATLIVTSVTEADARPGYRGGGYRGGGGYRAMAVGRGYRGGYGYGYGRRYGGYGGYGRGYRRYGYGLAAAGVAAGIGAAGYYRGGCGPYAYYDSYYGACRYY
jgi:hypothetical protein